MKMRNVYTMAIVATLSILPFSTSTVLASYKTDLVDNESRVVISGTITNKSGKTIKGAVVGLLNGKQYILTDKSGHYEIEVEKNSQLTISYLGCKSDTITATKSEQRNIQLYTQEDHKETKKTKGKKGNWFGGAGVGASTTF